MKIKICGKITPLPGFSSSLSNHFGIIIPHPHMNEHWTSTANIFLRRVVLKSWFFRSILLEIFADVTTPKGTSGWTSRWVRWKKNLLLHISLFDPMQLSLHIYIFNIFTYSYLYFSRSIANNFFDQASISRTRSTSTLWTPSTSRTRSVFPSARRRRPPWPNLATALFLPRSTPPSARPYQFFLIHRLFAQKKKRKKKKKESRETGQVSIVLNRCAGWSPREQDDLRLHLQLHGHRSIQQGKNQQSHISFYQSSNIKKCDIPIFHNRKKKKKKWMIK